MAGPEDEGPGDENLFYASQKAMLLLKLKLKNGDAVENALLEQLAYPGDQSDEEILVPLDLRKLDAKFKDEDDLIDEFMHLDIGRMIERLGAKATAEALVEAQQLYLDNPDGEDGESRMKPISAAEWKEIWGFNEGEEEAFLEEDEMLEEEELVEDEVEEEEEAAEPATKKAKTS
eukprot:TRINITY_DN56795_c0_g1_i1.p1 TRINITY_DN56795_c0_g1~~TRINITY_DN56795_c0_g1_i1.p1  ORF type:complete len:175 (-),score=62.91 TRINITY_DN56795_c0_g1_i1:82-606(-)